MSARNVERLDPRNAEDVRAYEEGFFRAFASISNPGTRAIWIWDDDAGCLRTRVPYEDQAVFFIRDAAGRVATGYAFNVEMREFQSQAYGFERPPNVPRCCETLAIFNLDPSRKVSHRCAEASRLFLQASGFEWSYATCASALLRLHRRGGWEEVAVRETDLGTRHLLRREVRRPLLPRAYDRGDPAA